MTNTLGQSSAQLVVVMMTSLLLLSGPSRWGCRAFVRDHPRPRALTSWKLFSTTEETSTNNAPAGEQAKDESSSGTTISKVKSLPVNYSMEEIVGLCKRRGLIFPSSEIYNGYAGFYDYGPIGVELKRQVKEAWWRTFVTQREDVVGLDSSIIHNPATWKSSGTCVHHHTSGATGCGIRE